MLLNKKFSGGPVAGRDALYRTLPMAENVGSRRTDRYVGMFYFIHLGSKEGYTSSEHSSGRAIIRGFPSQLNQISLQYSVLYIASYISCTLSPERVFV